MSSRNRVLEGNIRNPRSSVKNPWEDQRSKRDAEIAQTAQRMQAFYEPAWFGQQSRKYGGPVALSRSGPLPLPDMSGMPTTIGGMPLASPSGYMKGLEYEEPGQSWWQKGLSLLPGVDLRDQVGSVKERDLTADEKTEMDRQWRARQADEAPPVGQANLAGYGQGQLKNYGMGGMVAYQPMMREEYLRWR